MNFMGAYVSSSFEIVKWNVVFGRKKIWVGFVHLWREKEENNGLDVVFVHFTSIWYLSLKLKWCFLSIYLCFVRFMLIDEVSELPDSDIFPHSFVTIRNWLCNLLQVLAMLLGATPFLRRLIFTPDAPLFFFTDSCIMLG